MTPPSSLLRFGAPLAVALAACPRAPSPLVSAPTACEPSARSVVGSASTSASTSTSVAPSTSASACVEPTRRGHVDAAWAVGDRVFHCLDVEGEYPDPTKKRACASLSLGDRSRRAEPATSTPPRGWSRPTSGLEATSRTGHASFTLTGGARVPHGATARLDRPGARPQRTHVDYDEHLFFDGWIGDAIVLHTTVDEGPGCTRRLFKILEKWSLAWDDGFDLTGCYDTLDLVFDAGGGDRAFVDGGGGEVAFVDAATAAVTIVKTGRAADLDSGDVAVAAASETLGLVLVYGEPVAGDVVQIDLGKRAVVATHSLDVCAK